MTNTASKRYAEAMERLRMTNAADYKAVKSRVESWKTIADKWRAQAQGMPETPSATQWRKSAEAGQHIIRKLEQQVADLKTEVQALKDGDTTCH